MASKQEDYLPDEVTCSNCGNEGTWGACPFAVEMGDTHTSCNCCSECSTECRENI